eukprot:Hpha_TRINITY_DN20932_c0_g1::TRINITY_DN20932_c0_g1_i1::g.139675::m.139675
MPIIRVSTPLWQTALAEWVKTPPSGATDQERSLRGRVTERSAVETAKEASLLARKACRYYLPPIRQKELSTVAWEASQTDEWSIESVTRVATALIQHRIPHARLGEALCSQVYDRLGSLSTAEQVSAYAHAVARLTEERDRW